MPKRTQHESLGALIARQQRRDDPQEPGRRLSLKMGGGVGLARTLAPTSWSVLGLSLAGCTTPKIPNNRVSPLKFEAISASYDDKVRVPSGYRARVLLPWGAPLGVAHQQPDIASPGGQQAAPTRTDLSVVAGMHHDGMGYFPLQGSVKGLLAINHEYLNLEHLLGGRTATFAWQAEHQRVSQAAVGVSIVEVRQVDQAWQVQRPSPWARQINAQTTMRFDGPAQGSARLASVEFPDGQQTRGTFANCAMGQTPWGTYLTCEENFNGFFKAAANPNTHHKRYGLTHHQAWAPWYRLESRFDLGQDPNSANQFGWVVEIDPYDPTSTPIKHTALGRFKHESATVRLASTGQVQVYMGDDEPFEYLYKFVSRSSWQAPPAAAELTAKQRHAAANLLAEGTLYVARFDDTGRGTWLPLVWGQGPLTTERGFADQADVLIHARLAADALGATPLDRVEWCAVDPLTNDVYATLTGNEARGTSGRPGLAPASPHAPNQFGHIVRIRDGDSHQPGFQWDIFDHGGKAPPARQDAAAYANPDGLWIDQRGVAWVQTDMLSGSLARQGSDGFGNNQLVAIDTHSGERRRFLTGPRGCEITGACLTPDGRTLFVNIQHPGEGGRQVGDRAYSTWPSGREGDLPRSATVVVQRDDGGLIGD